MKQFYRNYFIKLDQTVQSGADKEEIFTPDLIFTGALQNLSGEKTVRNETGEKIINKKIFTHVFELSESDRIEGVTLHEIQLAEIGTFYKSLPNSEWKEVLADDVGRFAVAYNATDINGTNFEYDSTGKEYIIENINNVMYLNRSMQIECFERARTV